VTRPRPLDGLLVLDFSQYVAGPRATMLLSDLGADVIKVERPGGDAYRHYDPVVPGQSRYFCSLNRGKRSVICDLARPEGRELAAGLIARADAVVHNFLPSRAAAFGLDAAAVKRINDRAVVCAISAFGSVGPEAGTPGYDLIAQAVAGLLASATHTGQQVPERLGRMPLADFTTGLLAAVAVLTGLLQRQRAPGAPDFEVSLLGASLTLQAQQLATEQDTTGQETTGQETTGQETTEQETDPARRFDAQAMREQTAARAAAAELEPFYRCYETADAFIAVGCLDVAQRRRLLATLDLADPYVENPQRPAAHEQERSARAALVREVERRLLAGTAAEWIERFTAAGVPVAEVRTLDAAAASAQARANGLIISLDQPGLGPTRLLGGVVKQGGEPLVTTRRAPGPGEHQHELERLAAVGPGADDRAGGGAMSAAESGAASAAEAAR
jgi:crotonobetainyl-CoA:carnitine CoA-transferase CaiB-like acyl-CoA transferase